MVAKGKDWAGGAIKEKRKRSIEHHPKTSMTAPLGKKIVDNDWKRRTVIRIDEYTILCSTPPFYYTWILLSSSPFAPRLPVKHEPKEGQSEARVRSPWAHEVVQPLKRRSFFQLHFLIRIRVDPLLLVMAIHHDDYIFHGQ